uniref:Uncharacterized protein n=1 Tax=Arundo donax TaxID=35708 RepID=A0A0A9BV01_ARUDO
MHVIMCFEMMLVLVEAVMVPGRAVGFFLVMENEKGIF